VYGAEHVPAHGGALIVSNHQSFLDPVVLGVRLGRPLSYIAKAELFEIAAPVTWVLRSLGAFPVRQGAGDVGAVKECIRRLKEGHMLNIFPEGQRTEDGEIGRMEKGVALIVRRARVPVVPAVVVGAFEAWPIGAAMFRCYPVRVEFGAPMDLADLDADEIVGRIDGTLRRMFAELRERCGVYAVAGGM
jgi:1-acyl-sn-glycerol-3-phosphate acyltransferase